MILGGLFLGADISMTVKCHTFKLHFKVDLRGIGAISLIVQLNHFLFCALSSSSSSFPHIISLGAKTKQVKHLSGLIQESSQTLL